MKTFSKALLICIFVAFGFTFTEIPNAVFATHLGQTEGENLRFHWAFGARVGTQSNHEFVSITRDTTLKTGDQFKMLVELKTKCFVYLIYHGAKGELYLLFPYNSRQFDNGYKILKKYYIPQGNQWFTLDENVGRETFYLLFSAVRLTKLEDLIVNYESSDLMEKSELTTKIITEIHQLIKQHRRFASVAERPISIGGSVRGINKAKKAPVYDISNIAVEISATDFYSRTFTIEHK